MWNFHQWFGVKFCRKIQYYRSADDIRWETNWWMKEWIFFLYPNLENTWINFQTFPGNLYPPASSSVSKPLEAAILVFLMTRLLNFPFDWFLFLFDPPFLSIRTHRVLLFWLGAKTYSVLVSYTTWTQTQKHSGRFDKMWWICWSKRLVQIIRPWPEKA